MSGVNGISRHHAALLVISLLVMFAEGYDVQVPAFTAPLLREHLGATATQLGRMFGVGLTGYMIGATWLSGFSDQWGRRRTAVMGSAWLGVLTLATTFATDMTTITVLRFAAGLGLGVTIPAVMALNSEFAPPRFQSIWLTMMFVGYALGGSLGGILAAEASARFGWQAAFVIGGVAPLVSAALIPLFVPESVQLMVDRGVPEARVRTVAARFRMAVPAPSTDQAGTRPGRLPVAQLFRDNRARLTLLIWGAFVMSLLGHHFLTSWMPTILKERGLPFQRAVFIGSLLLGGSVIGAPLIGAMIDRFGRRVLPMAYLLSAPAVAMIGWMAVPVQILPAIVLFVGITLIGGQTALNAVATLLYPTSIRSTGLGWALGIGRMGAIIGPLVGGLLLDARVSQPVIFALAATPGVICALLLLSLMKIGAAQAPPEPQAAVPAAR